MNINTVNTSTPVETLPREAVMPPPAPDRTASVQAVEKNQQAAPLEEKESKFSKEELKELAAEMNELMDDLQTSLGFYIREDLDHTVVVEIKNRETDELVKQIPSEELLAIKEKMEEFSGLIFDQNV